MDLLFLKDLPNLLSSFYLLKCATDLLFLKDLCDLSHLLLLTFAVDILFLLLTSYYMELFSSRR